MMLISHKFAYLVTYYALLSTALTVACLLRVNLFSFLYGLFLLLVPFTISSPSPQHLIYPKNFLICLSSTALLLAFAQIIFNASSFSSHKLPSRLHNKCAYNEMRYREIGFERLEIDKMPHALRIIAPEAIVFITGVLLLFWTANFEELQSKESANMNNEKRNVFSKLMKRIDPEIWKALSTMLYEIIFCISLVFAAVFHPSLLSSVYLLTFTAVIVFWALNKTLTWTRSLMLRRFIMIFSSAHLLLLYLYQLPTTRRFLPPLSITARLLGLLFLRPSPCDQWPIEPITIQWTWSRICSPAMIFILNMLVAFQIHMKKNSKAELIKHLDIGDMKVSNADKSKQKATSAKIEKRQLSLGSGIYARGIMDMVHDQSYVVTLFVMMAWSLLYHSWLTFVLLAISSALWIMHPKSQKLCLKISPYIAIYAQVLVFIHYIYAFDLTQSELPDEHPTVLRQIGFEKCRDEPPWRPLTIKCFFTFLFWWTVKQRETKTEWSEDRSKSFKRMESVMMILGSTEGSSIKSLLLPLLPFLKQIIAKYWVIVNLCLLLAISLQSPVVIYRIIYMAFFQVFIGCFQVSFRRWRKFLYYFWMLMVAYCIFVLSLIYTYQFHGFPDLYKEYLGMSEDVLRSFGLEHFSSGQLFIHLLTPISFLVFTLIQMNYFHANLMKRTGKLEDAYCRGKSTLSSLLPRFHRKQNGLLSILAEPVAISFDKNLDTSKTLTQTSSIKNRPPCTGKYVKNHEVNRTCTIKFAGIDSTDHDDDDDDSAKNDLWAFISETVKSLDAYRNKIINLLWRFTEIHIDKFIAFTMIHIAIKEISAVNIPFLIYIVITLLKNHLTRKMSHFASIWTAIIIILKMIYQMEFIHEDSSTIICKEINGGNDTVKALEWLGLHKTTGIFQYTMPHIFLTVLLAFRTMVEMRQELHRYMHGEVTPIKGVLFSGIGRKDADINCLKCCAYLMNFGFYRFGLETCFVINVIAIGRRSDVVSVIFALILFIMLFMKRPMIARFWPYYTAFISILFIWQYIICVGIPKAFCAAYPWSFWDHNMIEWLFLPDFIIQPNPTKLYADFFLLLSASLQLDVFQVEQNNYDYPGGFNGSITDLSGCRKMSLTIQGKKAVTNQSSVPDYTATVNDTLLNQIKRLIFFYTYWLTLAILFIAGTSRVTLLTFGYVIGCFLFLWIGNSLFLRPRNFTLKLWNKLIMYNVAVIFAKISLQVVGCVYMSQMYKHYCWILQLFGIACLKTGMRPETVVDPIILVECNVPHREAYIFHDGICFIFLLIQRRIFGSPYFDHVVAEIRAQKFLASRGAEIIQKITKRELEDAEQHEEAILSKVKEKMDRIRSKHEREMQLYEEARNSSQGDKIARSDAEQRAHLMPLQAAGEYGDGPKSSAFPNGLKFEEKQTDPAIGTHESITSYSTASVMLPTLRENYLEEKEPFKKISQERTKVYSIPTLQRKISEEMDEDAWSIDDKLETKYIDGDGGVKGFGPLQLLNYAFKKGEIKEALKESHRIETAHTRLQREMEDAFGIVDHDVIRRAILRHKSRRTKADYDESTFSEEALTTRDKDELDVAVIESNNSATSTSFPFPSLQSTTIEGAIDTLASLEMHKKDAEEQLTKKWKIDGYYEERSTLKEVFSGSLEFLRNLAVFLHLFGTGVIESTITNLLRLSRNYRFVEQILTTEKQIHKEIIASNQRTNDLDLRTTIQDRRRSIMRRRDTTVLMTRIFDPDESMTQMKQCIQNPERGINDAIHNHRNEQQHLEAQPKKSEQYRPTIFVIDQREKNWFIRLIYALYYAMLSRSEMICYLMIVLNHMNSASILSLPLPLMTLLWGTQTVPRPSTKFWITIITYTQIMVVVKYIFQFGFFPWNKMVPSVHPFWPPRILGIEKRDKYAAWDLALLITLFFHRNVLMSVGLWDGEKSNQELINGSAAIEKRTPSVEQDDNFSTEKIKMDSLLFASQSKRKLFVKGIKSVIRTVNTNGIFQEIKRRLMPIHEFFHVLLNPVDRFPLDLYAPMFLCDVICFLIIIFGYSAFGTDSGGVDGGVTAYFAKNKVPGTLVTMLILQFVLIILDRAIFLRKFLIGKIVSQFVLVIFVHIWLFFLLPAATDRMFVNNFPCKLFYLVKVVYFIISAKQIQAGYPKRSLGNIITNSYGITQWALYKVFMLVPFLFELRALMDWMWIDTSLGVSDWFMLNDIYTKISMIKCERKIEEQYPSPKGVKKRPLLKYGLGGVLLTAIILIIWFPLVIFSMANTVGTRSLPVECTCRLTIAGFEPLFQSTAQLSDIRELTDGEYNDLKFTYRMSKVAQSYLADYDRLDIVRATINGNSSSRWSISPPSKAALINDLTGKQLMNLKFEWDFKRAPNDNLQFGKVEDFRVIELEKNGTTRNDLAEVLTTGSKKLIRIPHLLIPFVKVPGDGKAEHVYALLSEHLKNDSEHIENSFYDALLQLDSVDGVEWWKLRMVDPRYDPVRINQPVVLDNIVIHGFVDKVFPVTFSIITGGGIISLYLSMVLVFGRLMRSVVTGAMQRIMFEELPNVDRILKLCLDIFLVREAGELQLEEDLFAKLVFLFRSPATLIKWTKEKTN